jgi:ketosteroid isomerase-like protein
MVAARVFQMAVLILVVLTPPALALQPQEAQEISRLLNTQADDWNKGDLEKFTAPYDEETRFVGIKDITIGRAEVLARYQKHYGASKGTMGQLSFTDLDIHVMGHDDAFVIGRFNLIRTPSDGGNATGIFTLVFHRQPSGWRIMLDHTP